MRYSWMRCLALILVLGACGCLPAICSDASLFPAFPAQLPPVHASGTYHYTELVHVAFMEKQEFPVDYVLEDYRGKEVFRTSIKSSAPVVVACDLPPGSYQVCYRMTGPARTDYLDDKGPAFFISANDIRAQEGSYVSNPSCPIGGPSLHFRRKIEPVYPLNHAQATGETVTFRWKPLPGIDRYTVSICPLDHPDHPDSDFVGERMLIEATGSHLTLPIGIQPDGDYLKSDQDYVWYVLDGTETEQSESGHHACSEPRVLSFPHLSPLRIDVPGITYQRDEGIETRLGLRLQQQPRMVADSCRNYLLITAVGGNTPAFLAGLTPGDKIASCNGKPVWSVGDFHRDLQTLAPGTPMVLGIVYDKESDATPLTWPCHVILK